MKHAVLIIAAMACFGLLGCGGPANVVPVVDGPDEKTETRGVGLNKTGGAVELEDPPRLRTKNGTPATDPPPVDLPPVSPLSPPQQSEVVQRIKALGGACKLDEGEIILVALVDNPRVTDEQLRHLEGLPRLQTLRLSNCQHITGAGLVHLRGSQELRRLSLGRTQVNDDSMKLLRLFPQLIELDLYDTKLTDHGLAHVTSCPRLESIKLQHTKISDLALSHLSALPRLKSLWVRDTRVSAAGIETLNKARPGIKIRW